MKNNKEIRNTQQLSEKKAQEADGLGQTAASATPTPGFVTTTGAIFEPFSWLPLSTRGKPHEEFVARTRDVCRGVQACLQISHSDGMDRDSDHETLLSINQSEHLLLLATQAVAMLAEEADREIERMHERAKAEVQS